ncbi:succinyldiaminopimelate transaminase [Guyparkeria hydrothermalis]|uniref:succinyldiaminopimelate transaminase n=1 Tax=Guyparkeria hydrothermalis TaxID=923 RepID=UPI00201FCE59|nr:succinyldiaminopimelate transaminase [Guyparkeria hydrothermalis]MCL7744819.1 succinyldiaminopimelate transaminase [Guyparkeria hydrothermalis]
MNSNLDRLHPYPFEKLAELKAGAEPPTDRKHIPLSIGEPRHAPPAIVLDTLRDALPEIARYPATKGEPALREAMAGWLTRRFSLDEGLLDPEANVLPVAGTREALFAIAQAVVDRNTGDQPPVVLMPNPFYQIYEGAALLAGAEPYYYPTLPENGFLPDFEAIPESIWQRAQLLYVCSPGNPSGAVIDAPRYRELLARAARFNVVIAADECYSEIYFDEEQPPTGLLEVAATRDGDEPFRNVIVFHSLSKRSNLPGLRSGLVAGDAAVLKRFLRYRTYQGCALPLPTQQASITAWNDEAHVRANRDFYREKFDAVLDILDPVDGIEVRRPDAGFYLWARVEGDERDFARRLFAEQNVTVLPGRFLSREADGVNPGAGFVRMALVAELEDCVEAAKRIRAMLS